jgi:hypothetical protein
MRAEGGSCVQQSSESDRFVVCSEHIVLECGSCGERLMLLGFESDWHSEGRTAFECQCGERLTLTDRIDEETARLNALLRRFGVSDDQ